MVPTKSYLKNKGPSSNTSRQMAKIYRQESNLNILQDPDIPHSTIAMVLYVFKECNANTSTKYFQKIEAIHQTLAVSASESSSR